MYINETQKLKIQEELFNFYKDIILAIRTVDKTTTIIIDSTAYADPNAFAYLKPHKEQNILYSFHMYEPYAYTCKKINQGKLGYPGKINNKLWDKNALINYLQEVINFQKRYNIPNSKILVGEFGGHITAKGLDVYFKDLIDIFNTHKWHFAFYAFREDTWDGMDYELGDKQLPYSYWQAISKGKSYPLNRKGDHNTFKILQKALQ